MALCEAEKTFILHGVEVSVWKQYSILVLTISYI